MTGFSRILSIASRDLPAAGVDCLLIGGFAVNHYGYSRNTLDVDFMIVADQVNATRRVMTEAGFTNVSVLDNVVFFSSGDAEPRVDFLKVDAETMQKLLANAVEIRVRGCVLQVPVLRDLLAMKVFSLTQSTARRMGKDLPDIAFLTVINDLDLQADIRPLCERFGSAEIYELIHKQVEGLRQP
ncbi:MAG: nucleotidyltransferase [Kiritimatiellae bacterium]|nr:nucleotidyltransferase [Kiritimatiellia bacterium]